VTAVDYFVIAIRFTGTTPKVGRDEYVIQGYVSLAAVVWRRDVTERIHDLSAETFFIVGDLAWGRRVTSPKQPHLSLHRCQSIEELLLPRCA
jgi:hypothetical protein